MAAGLSSKQLVATTVLILVAVHANASSCPFETQKLNGCGEVLSLLNVGADVPEDVADQCCPLLRWLTDLDAAVCLCTAIKSNHITVGDGDNVDADLLLLLSRCNKTPPPNYTCSL